MEFSDSKAFATELQQAWNQWIGQSTRASLRRLNRCLEGLHFVPESGTYLRLDNSHCGRTKTLMRIERTKENDSVVSWVRQLQANVEAALRGDTQDFEDEYSEQGRYAKSGIWTTAQLLNPIDSSSYSVTHILPLEVRLRMGID